MRNLTGIILLLICTQIAFAQNSKDSLDKSTGRMYEDKSVKNEVGFDMFFFLNIFRQHYEGQPSTVFTIFYNRELNDKISLRTELGSGYTNTSYKMDTLRTLHTKIIQEILKVGVAWKKTVFRGWQFYYGADLEFQYGDNSEQQNESANNVIDTHNTIYYVGPGPFVGLIVYINPRVSLSIESNLNFVYNFDKESTVDGGNPALSTTSTTKGFSTSYITPQDLNLSIKF